MDKSKTLIALLLCTPIFGIGIDLYTPSLPHMSAYFNSTAAATKLSISLFMLGAFIGMIVFGTIADALGRRKIVLWSLALNIVFNIAIALSPSMSWVIIFRFITGICAGSVSSMNRAQATDIFSAQEMKKVSSSMTIAWGLGPILAPFIGGLLQEYISWKASFVFLAFYSFILMAFVYRYVPETHVHKHKLSLSKVFANYKLVLSCQQFLGAILQSGVLYMLLLYFGIIGSFYIQEILYYSAAIFGYISLFIGIAYFAGTIVRRLLSFVDDKILMNISFAILLMSNIVFLIMSFAFSQSLSILLINIFIACFLTGILYPIYLSKTLSLFPQLGGTAGAITGAAVMLIISVMTSIASLFRIHTLTEFVVLYLVTVVIVVIIQMLTTTKKS